MNPVQMFKLMQTTPAPPHFATGFDETSGVPRIRLNDGREISLPLGEVPWLKWLAKATPKQRANWSLEPGGYAIYWPDLDDGIEVCHLLNSQAIV
jgi:hypothetical protein